MPEEINRVVTDHVSDLLFAPTPSAVKHLQAENRPTRAIHHCGDIMFDAALQACRRIDEAALLQQFGLHTETYTLATLHRAENTDKPARLLTWLEALNKIAAHEQVILPLHPRTRQRIADNSKTIEDYPNIRFIEPIGYETMAALTKNAHLVVTDSGGLQKEAYFHKTPCLILREETEWVELTENGWSRLIKCNPVDLLDAHATHAAPTALDDDLPFGNGTTAQSICDVIIESIK